MRSIWLLAKLASFLLLSAPVAIAAPRKLDALAADPTQWPMPAKNHASTRFSELDQINTSNVSQLQLAWSFSLNADRGQEAAPLVIDNMIYVIAPYSGPSPNQVFALDATTGVLKWTYAPKPEPAAAGVACCDVVSRGIAYDNGRIFLNTLDDHTVAVDAASGQELWRVKLGDISRGETMTMAPFVAKGKVLVGNSGGEMGVRGWLTALDENTGKIVWRAYSTGPDADVLIGPDFKPFYNWAKSKDLGVTSWPPEAWKIGGGTVWGWISYDPQTNLIFYGTANPGPWNAEQRPGDNLWTSTIFARDVDTGAAKWADPIDPHDLFDYDEVNENLLLELPVNGVNRKIVLHVGRNGYMYVIDRVTGEIYSADAYDTVNATHGIDLKTGRPIENEAKRPIPGRKVTNICPAAPGAKDWQPTAWSPRTKLLYVPHQHLCMDFTASDVAYLAGTPYVGAKVHMHAGEGGYRGEFLAWDPVARKRVFAIRENFPVWSGALVTAGDVAFYGTMDRLFKAVDARDGKPLWQMRIGSGVVGQPVTYQGRDGAQYIAVLSGVGGWAGALAAAEIDPKVPYGALGFVGAMQDLPNVTRGGGELLVFRLPPSSTEAQRAPRP